VSCSFSCECFGTMHPFLEIDVGEHHPVAGDEPAVEQGRDLLARHLVPPVPGDGADGLAHESVIGVRETKRKLAGRGCLRDG